MTKRDLGIGPTPAGGMRSDIVYTDEQGNVVDKSKATRAIIREMDRKGKVLRETFGVITHDRGSLDKS